jgi:pyruvate-ferredoxin/flavodoxin oxidoreductase
LILYNAGHHWLIDIPGNDNQEVADLNIISRKIAELSLNPAAVGQDGFLTSHLIEDLQLPVQNNAYHY